MLRVASANLAGFGLVSKCLADVFLKPYLGIEYKLAAAHFPNRVKYLLTLRTNDNDPVLSFVRRLVMFRRVRPNGFGRVDQAVHVPLKAMVVRLTPHRRVSIVISAVRYIGTNHDFACVF